MLNRPLFGIFFVHNNCSILNNVISNNADISKLIFPHKKWNNVLNENIMEKCCKFRHHYISLRRIIWMLFKRQISFILHSFFKSYKRERWTMYPTNPLHIHSTIINCRLLINLFCDRFEFFAWFFRMLSPLRTE